MRWEAPLNYANAEYFVEEVYQTVGCFPEQVKKEMDKLKEERKVLKKVYNILIIKSCVFH